MRWITAALLCLSAAATAQAQIYRFKVYTSNTGLPNNAVYSIFQDSKGYIWFGTDVGVCRYDGLNYANYSVRQGLADAPVRDIFEDRNGRIWIMTRGGLSSFDGSRFTNYTAAEGLPHNETRCGLQARDGRFWFGTAKGLSLFDGDRFKNYGTAEGLPEGPVWTMVEDREGMLWLGLRGGGLVKFDGSRFTAYGRKDGLPNENVFDLVEDPSGGLWIATDGGLCRFDGKSFRSYTVKDGLGSNLVSCVLIDKQNRVWCGTFGRGVARLEGDRFIAFNRSNGLPDNYFISLYADHEGNIWFGARWGGACRFSSELFANYTAAVGIGDGVITGAAEAPDGSLWFSSINDGLAKLSPGGSAKRYGKKDGMIEEGLWTVFIDSRGRVWSGGQDGVSYFEGGRFKNFTLEQMGAHSRIVTISEDGRGRIWFGSDSSTSNGVIVYDGEKFSSYSTEQGLVDNQTNAIIRDRAGNIWICTEGGLSRFDGERFVNYKTEQGLPNNHVLSAYEDAAGKMWIGTAEGLSCFDGAKFQNYSSKDGLAGDVIRALTGDGATIWIGTSHGLSTFDGRAFRNYTVKDGLISNDISTRAAFRQRDGTIWFGTTEGAVRYRAVAETRRRLPPRVYFSGIRARGNYLGVQSGFSLPHDHSSVTFEFLGLSFVDEESVRYSYLLEGLDREWSQPFSERYQRFTNLEPGNYRFQVKAVSAAGLWSEPISISLTIKPPYWQTWWFRLIVLATLAAAAVAVYLWRVWRLERRHRKRIESLRRLLEGIRAINSQLDLAAVLQNIAAESAQIINGEPGGIGLIRDGKVRFDRLWLKDRWEDCSIEYDFGNGVAGIVGESGSSYIVNDPQSDPNVIFPELIRKYYVNGFIDVPIKDRNGETVGVLDVRRREAGALLGEDDRQLLESFAHQAAVAIENAGLYGSLAEKNQMIVESLREIEGLYENEQQVTRALQELNQMKTNFMIVASHEMRTPLTILKGYHELLVDGYLGELSDPQSRSLDTCRRTIDRLIESFNDILELLKIDERRLSLKPAPLDLKMICEEVLADLSDFISERNQRAELEASKDLPLVQADLEKMRLVLLNLIQNAIKFTPDQGRIRIRIMSEDDSIHVAVEDDGIGIEHSDLERIFERFYTSPDTLHHTSGDYKFEARGTGLGLSIAKSYVEAHGGRVWAESEGKNRGSSFHVVLPLICAQPAEIISREAVNELRA